MQKKQAANQFTHFHILFREPSLYASKVKYFDCNFLFTPFLYSFETILITTLQVCWFHEYIECLVPGSLFLEYNQFNHGFIKLPFSLTRTLQSYNTPVALPCLTILFNSMYDLFCNALLHLYFTSTSQHRTRKGGNK